MESFFPEPIITIHPPLSRSQKAKEWLADQSSSIDSPQRRKRLKVDTKVCLRRISEQRGVGLFCTRPISCGEVIIEDETPIVSTNGTGHRQGLYCEKCSSPLGNLRSHILSAGLQSQDPANSTSSQPTIYLPTLEHHIGLTFQSNQEKNGRCCKVCEKHIWCSRDCKEAGELMHYFAFCGRFRDKDEAQNLHNFLESVDNPPIFKLAFQGMLLAFWALVSGIKSGTEESKEMQLAEVLWWKDYGSHPLWWTIGPPEKKAQRKEITKRFCGLTVQRMIERLRGLEKIPSDILPCEWSFLHESASLEAAIRIVPKLFENDHVGRLLGTLQSNVMAFEFASPLQQFVDHLGQMEEDDEPFFPARHDLIDDSDTWDMVRRGEEWLQTHQESLRDRGTPAEGSGLYPLLTLGNHSCDPNASIDFLRESNVGSMVALRDITPGEEICITYIPNGDLDPGGTSARFDAMEPTRTWQFLNGQAVGGQDMYDDSEEVGEEEEDYEGAYSESGGEESTLEPEEGGQNVLGDQRDADLKAETSESEDNEITHGRDYTQRSHDLLQFGFRCDCPRCIHERRYPTLPYQRKPYVQ